MKIEIAICRIKCGGVSENSSFRSEGTAFLINTKYALTAYHVIRDGESQEVVLDFTAIGRMGIKGKVVNFPTQNDKIDIALIELEEEVNTDLFTLKEGELYKDERWETYGYPALIAGGNSAGTTVGGTISQHKSPQAYQNDLEKNWDIELLVDSGRLQKYNGLSGAPLIVGGCVVGVIIVQNSGSRLYALSLIHTKDMLSPCDISIAQRAFPLATLPDYTKYEGLNKAQTFWESWTTGETHSISPSLLLQGRLEIYNSIKESLQSSNPQIIRIEAASREEVIAFTIASIMSFDRNLLGKCFIVESESALQALADSPIPLIIIPKLENDKGLQAIKNKGHHIILPVEYKDDGHNEDNFVLPKLDRDGFIKEMVNTGFTQAQAETISLETSRNIMVLRRYLKIETFSPAWAKAETARELIPALLMGRWNEEHQGDREKIAFLANMRYEEYIQMLSKWLKEPDTPIYKIGNKWRLAAPLDAWYYLAKHLTQADMLNLGKVYLEVLQEIHPAMDLEPEKRYMANILGKVAHYSDWAKKGLCHSLILVAVYGNNYKLETPKPSEIWVEEIISEIFREADINKWSSLSSYLPLIAEAAPDAFLSILETYLAKKADVIMTLFKEYNGMITPVTYHSNLLWALENLAWFPAYIKRTAIIIARLAALDPGGSFANRPITSLRNIFLPWSPQTYVNFEGRYQILNTIIQKTPTIAWQLLLQIMPNVLQTLFPAHKTRWRLYNEDAAKNITYQELYDNHSFIIEKMVILAGNEESRITQLLEISIQGSQRLRYQDWKIVIKHIKTNVPYIAENPIEYVLWNKIRHILYHHRTHHDTDWALDANRLSELEEIYAQIEPKDIFASSKWIFENDWIELPKGMKDRENGRNDYQAECRALQTQTLALIYQQKSFDEVLLFGLSYERPYTFIHIFSQIIETNEQVHKILDLIKSEDTKNQEFAKYFFLKKEANNGLAWATNLYHTYLKDNYTEMQTVSLFAALRVKRNEWRELWDFVSTISEDATRLYWQMVSNIHFGDLEEEDKIFAFKELQNAGRHNFVLYEAHLYGEVLPTEFLISVLDNAQYNKDELHNPYPYQYAPQRIFEILHQRADAEEEKVMLLEWKYLQNLVSVHDTYMQLKIHKKLAKDADLFLQFLKMLYVSDKEDQDKEDLEPQMKAHLARQAHTLFQSWKNVPGTDEDNHINEVELKTWIDTVRKLAEEDGRLRGADIEIGRILAQYPETTDDYPPNEICEVIETINSETIKRNYGIALFNKRGSWSKSLFEGGTRERSLADYFENLAEKKELLYPAIAQILRNLSKGYEQDAKREDDNAEEINLEY